MLMEIKIRYYLLQFILRQRKNAIVDLVLSVDVYEIYRDSGNVM